MSLREELIAARDQLQLAMDATNTAYEHQSKAFQKIEQLHVHDKESKCIHYIKERLHKGKEEVAGMHKCYMDDDALVCRISELIDEFLEYGDFDELEEESS